MFLMYHLPLQAVSGTQIMLWEQFARFQEGLGDQVRREEKRLQAEACRLTPDDPEFFEKLMGVGPGARVFFRRYPFYLYLSFHPVLHEWVLQQLEKFVSEFQVITDEVRAAAQIPPTQWVAEEYSYDLAEVVADLPLLQQANAAELAPQVMAAHEVRCSTSHQLQMS